MRKGLILALMHTKVYMSWSRTSNHRIEEEIGKRIQKVRLLQNLTQKDLAQKAGLSRGAVSKIERGQGATLSSMIEIMRVLRLLDSFEQVFPTAQLSPLEIVKLEGKQRKRASSSPSKPNKRKASW